MAKTEKSRWDKMIYDFINMYHFNRYSDPQDVFDSINKYLQNKYKLNATKERIRAIADDVAESICLKIKIPHNYKIR